MVPGLETHSRTNALTNRAILFRFSNKRPTHRPTNSPAHAVRFPIIGQIVADLLCDPLAVERVAGGKGVPGHCFLADIEQRNPIAVGKPELIV